MQPHGEISLSRIEKFDTAGFAIESLEYFQKVRS